MPLGPGRFQLPITRGEPISVRIAFSRKVGINAIHEINHDGTSGTFTLTYPEGVTAAIAWNASSDAIENAIEAVLGLYTVSVTGVNPWQVEYVKDLREQSIALPSIQAAGLVGDTFATVQDFQVGEYRGPLDMTGVLVLGEILQTGLATLQMTVDRDEEARGALIFSLTSAQTTALVRGDWRVRSVVETSPAVYETIQIHLKDRLVFLQ